MYIGLWTVLTSINGLRKTSNKGKGKVRLSLKIGGILGRTDTILIVPGQSGFTTAQVVNTVFQEPVHQVLEKIKNESYFKWPNKMGGDPMKRNQSLHCQYHQERGHTTEDCRILWNHLEQLVREGRLK